MAAGLMAGVMAASASVKLFDFGLVAVGMFLAKQNNNCHTQPTVCRFYLHF
jgi:hypothetical protein